MDIGGKSFTSYSKVDELKERQNLRKTRKRLLVIVVSGVVLVTLTIVAILGTRVFNKSNDPSSSSNLSSSDSFKAVCNVTRYPNSCYSSMSSTLSASSKNKTNQNSYDPEELFLLSLQVAYNELSSLTSLPQKIFTNTKYSNETNDPLVKSSLHDCETLFSDSVDEVNQSMGAMQVGQGDKTMFLTSKIDDIRTWLSTALTNLGTCLEGLSTTGKHLILAEDVGYSITNATEFTSNSLAIASNLLTVLNHLPVPIHRKLLTIDGHDRDLDRILHVGFPRWVQTKERRLLSEGNLEPDLTVAKDGSGNFTTISEALNHIPRESDSRFVVYVKQGVYVENITLDKDIWNIMIYGDGMTKTIVSYDLNKLEGTSTFSTGTFIAEGKGFIARDMGFKNKAGPQKAQAVALRSSSDQSVFYRCSFDAYQDTLYIHSNRQFYRECLIKGTIDFIFGNAAVIFQNCTIQPKQPMAGPIVTITAQGKFDPNQNTGISIHRCQITKFENLTATTFLGRPWKNYSTTVITKSFIGGFLDPLGWTEWQPNVEPPKTIFYAEYQNFGPGSATDKRVRWAGVSPNITQQLAERFTVEPFIRGSLWLPKASITFDSTL